jgi:sorbitol-specific phosphotransferase system component IIBC
MVDDHPPCPVLMTGVVILHEPATVDIGAVPFAMSYTSLFAASASLETDFSPLGPHR